MKIKISEVVQKGMPCADRKQPDWVMWSVSAVAIDNHVSITLESSAPEFSEWAANIRVNEVCEVIFVKKDQKSPDRGE